MGILDFMNTQQQGWNAQRANSPYTPDMRLNAGMQSLGLLGGSLMAAGAPTTDPGQFGQIMGQSMANAGPMMQQSLDQQLQMQDMQAQREREAALQEYVAGGAGGLLSPEQIAVAQNLPPEALYGLLGDVAFAGAGDPFTLGEGQVRYDAAGNPIAEGPAAAVDPWDGINIPTGFAPIDPNNPAAGIRPLQGYDPNYGETPDLPDADYANFTDGKVIRSINLGTAEGQAEAAALANAGFYRIGTSVNANTLTDLGGDTVPGPLDPNGDPIDPGPDRYWVADDSTELGWRQEIIPGTEAEQEQAQFDEASENKQRIAIEKANNVISVIDQSFSIVDEAGWLDPATGLGGALLEDVPGSSAYQLKAAATTIKANLGFDALQAMRDASPTGGALGQVAIQELEALQSALANLDPRQGEEIMRINLQKVKDHYTNLIDIINESPAVDAGAAAGGDSIPKFRIENGALVPVE